MAEKAKDSGTGNADRDFRRAAALAVMAAYVTRHGGFNTAEEREAHCRNVWLYADALVACEHAPPPAPPAPPPEPPARKRVRPATPSDEWAVRDGAEIVKRSFATREEAEWYASGRPGTTVELVSGPELAAAAAAE